MHVMHVDSLRRLKVASASRNHAAGSVCQNRISVIFLGFLARWRGLEEQSIEVPVQTYIFQHLFWCILTNTKLRVFSAARELQARYSTVLYIIIQ